MAANIKFKRTSTTTLPTGLTFAEPAFVLGSAGTTTANQLYVGDNSGGRVWIGAKIENTVTNWTGTEANTLLATQQAIDARITSRLSSSGGFTFAATSGTPQTLTPGDTITIAAGTGISTTAGATDTVTIANTGVLSFNGSAGAVTGVGSFNGLTGSVTGVSSNIAGSGISVSGATGNVTITNIGVTGIQAGTAIAVSSATGNPTITNTGVQSLTISAGSGIQAATVSGTTGAITYTITNTGVTGIQAGTGIAVSSSTGNPTITNIGVISFNGSTGTVSGVGSAVAGTGISVSGATGTVTFTNTGVQSAAAGSGISVSGATGAVTFTNTGVTGIQAGTAISVSSSTGNVTVTNTGVQSIAGTANQITASGSTGAITLSLPSAVTMPGSLTVTGNLTVNGTTTTVNSTTITVQDPIISIGGLTGGAAPAAGDTKDRGIVALYRNTSDTAGLTGFFGIDQSTGYFAFVPNATLTAEVVGGTAGTANLNGVISTNTSNLVLTGQHTSNASITVAGAATASTSTVQVVAGALTVSDITGANGKISLSDTAANFTGTIAEGSLTGSRTYTLPDHTGTFVIPSDLGTSNFILKANGVGSQPTWINPNASGFTAFVATNVAGGTAGSLHYQTALNTTGMLSLGTANFLLTAGATAPQWTNPNASGFTAYVATNVITTEQSTGTYYLTFTTAASNAAALSVDATATTALSYNVATGTLTAAVVDALIDGGAY